MLKKKVWGTSPTFFIVTLTMIAMAVASWSWNRNVFYVELMISIISVVIIFIEIYNFRSYIHSTVRSSLKLIGNIDEKLLEKYSVPVGIFGRMGDVVWFNSAFRSSLCKGRDCEGETVTQFVSANKLESILNGKLENIRIDDRFYTVFGVNVDEAIVLYFIDDTYYKNIANEYNASKPSVAFIMFDNKEELEIESEDGENGETSVLLENTLQRWAMSSSSVIKKLSNGRYIMLIEERQLQKVISTRFKILEEVRNIKVDDRRFATISIGIGRGGKNLKENEHWARKALDMALGRGGDQVAIKTGDEYKFFGGVSKGTERRYKVRSRVIASTLIDQINQSDYVLIMGHKFSDLDCVGASIGMYSGVFKGQQKQAYIVVDEEKSLAQPLIKSMKNRFQQDIFISPDQAKDLITDQTLLIIVDTHSAGFVESPELYEMAKRIVVIDHHRMMVNHIKNAIVFYHEMFASSASEMVAELVQYLGDNNLDRLEAEAMLAGIMLDTKNFVLKTGVRTFEAAAYLRKKGADTVEVKRLFSNSIDTYKVKYQIISEAEIFNNCAIASADEKSSEIRLAAAQAADELLEINYVKASFVLFMNNDEVNISARSLGDVNVQLIMEAMGGGGHQTMAGAQIKGKTMSEVREKLIGLISGLENGTI